MLFKIFTAFVLFVFLSSSTAFSADLVMLESQVKELSMMVKDLKSIVERQQTEISALRALREIKETPVVAQAQAPRSLLGKWNPDIGVVADTVAKFDSPKADTEGSDRVSVRELELVLGSAVDPYSRFDTTISFSDFETAALEEAYLTRFGLPFDFKARIGRFKPRVGKAISVHRDSLDTVDESLPIERYFGVEGYNKTGVDVTKILNLPLSSTHEITLGVLEGGNGEGGTAFGSTRRRPTLYSHLKNFWDISENTGFELGASHLAGSKDADAHFEVNMFGLDVTLNHHLNANQSFKIQGETFYMNREETFTFNEDTLTDLTNLDGTLWGGYLLGDFRLNSQWSLGTRFDYAELVDNPVINPYKADIGYAGYLTFHQSEFARWRLQFKHIDLANGKDDNQVLLQGVFAIGEHKHKLQ